MQYKLSRPHNVLRWHVFTLIFGDYFVFFFLIMHMQIYKLIQSGAEDETMRQMRYSFIPQNLALIGKYGTEVWYTRV